MKILKAILKAVVVVALAGAVTGCGVSKIKDAQIESISVKDVTPTSLRSLDAVLILGIKNPGTSFSVSDLKAEVKLKGRPIGMITTGRIAVEKRCSAVYEVPCTAVLYEDVSLLSLSSLAQKDGMEYLTADVDVNFSLTKKGKGGKLTFKDLKIKDYL